MALLGEDGRGYELARKLESCGVWRTWLGDSTYANFAPFLSSPSAWDSFLRTDSSTSRAHLLLQLRVRALLFDKASASLLSKTPSPSPSRLNPYYLLLHADDVYFTLDDKNQSKTVSGTGSRYVDSELDSMSQRSYRNEELPETWYNQAIEKYKANNKLPYGDRESLKRLPTEMASYLMCVSNHKRRRAAFKDESVTDHGSTLQPNGGNLGDGDSSVFPEVTYAFNCVPDSALTLTNRVEINNKIKLLNVLDTLPPLRSPVMMDRLGIRHEYVNVEHGGGVYRGKLGPEQSSKALAPEQASKLSQKVAARILSGVGFEAAMEGSIENFSDVLSKRICHIGANLKVLTDSYKKQCSAIELLKMLLKTLGFSNFAPLVDVVKDGSKNIVQQSQQQVHGIQPQVSQQQSSLRIPQQVQMQRQIHPQMQQIINSHNLAFQQQQQQVQQQQQLERMRRRPASTPRPAMEIDKERPLVQVKIEATSDLPIDGNAFNSRHPQMQLRQQQMAAMSNFHSQPGNQFRQMGSLQIPPIQSPNISMVRAPPVKVEGFQELMGGDSSTKHDSEENRLTSPSGK